MLDYAGLAAVTAVLSEGSFERAAERLGVSSSAVSQRVRQMEERLGTVLVIRGQPCRPTEAGLTIWRHVDDVAELEAALRKAWPDVAGPDRDETPVTLRLAVNADSLATWLMPAIAGFTSETGHLVDLTIDDQDHTAEWLKSGAVVAAVTNEAAPLAGCRATPLGRLRYRATASPDFVARHFPDGVTAASLARAPAVTFNRKDNLQRRFVEIAVGRAVRFPTHFLPSSQAFVDAALTGIGWGLNPSLLVDPLIEAGRLVEIVPGRPLDVPLSWQVQRRGGPVIDSFGRHLVRAARAMLVAS